MKQFNKYLLAASINEFFEGVAFDQNTDLSVLATVLAMQVLSFETVQQIPAPVPINYFLKACFFNQTIDLSVLATVSAP